MHLKAPTPNFFDDLRRIIKESNHSFNEVAHREVTYPELRTNGMQILRCQCQ